ncbi:MAG: hypothetical protein QME41_01260 [Actinomycetota bacterium]|nr:hypothetical protein [Actinomycetota bacterium]
MAKRHDKVGIKQVIRLEWMEKTLDMLLAGMNPTTVRSELKEYLADKKQSGGSGQRGEKTYVMAIGPLANAWFSPDAALIPLRDAALEIARSNKVKNRLLLHWAMISPAYPFWFNVARQIGRLLNLQEQVTHQQIVGRLKEQYGDRETISRYTRYVIRSFVAWGVLKDSEFKGSYEKANPIIVRDIDLAMLLLEGALQAIPEGKSTMGLLMNTPALFPFQLPVMTGDLVAQRAPRIEVVRYGPDDELLKLIEHK